ncbi:MAG: hypothetical protein OEQ81_01470, partial [Flavobacteriaceae bacterium]|nr:hypothetical protein [Flavobacteriaceae bacterium]
NYKSNMDEAFMRRFNAIIKFPFPAYTERKEIWDLSFPKNVKFKNDVDIPSIVAQYELSGGSITNVVQYACIKMLSRNSDIIELEDVLKGIQREEEKIFKRFKSQIEVLNNL